MLVISSTEEDQGVKASLNCMRPSPRQWKLGNFSCWDGIDCDSVVGKAVNEFEE